MLPLDVGSGQANSPDPPAHPDPQTPTMQMVTEQINEMVIANAIAHAIRAIPGVLDMGQGLFAKAATYGPGKHIPGIVLRRLAPGELSVDIHVVLDEATFFEALTDVSSGADDTPILLRFTSMIRVVIVQTFEHLGLPAPTTVDVTIDDIR